MSSATLHVWGVLHLHECLRLNYARRPSEAERAAAETWVGMTVHGGKGKQANGVPGLAGSDRWLRVWVGCETLNETGECMLDYLYVRSVPWRCSHDVCLLQPQCGWPPWPPVGAQSARQLPRTHGMGVE